MTCAAKLCPTCPFLRSAPKAGEPGGSVPAHAPARMGHAIREVTEGFKVMRCHDSIDTDPRPCAGFLSVVGYQSVGVRLAVFAKVVRHEDVGRRIRGLYGSLREMLWEADRIHLAEDAGRPKRG